MSRSSLSISDQLDELRESSIGGLETLHVLQVLELLLLLEVVEESTCSLLNSICSQFGANTNTHCASDFTELQVLEGGVVDHGVDLHVLEERAIETVEYAVTCGLAGVCEDWTKTDQVLESIVVNGDGSASELLEVALEIRVSCNAS